MGKFLNKKTQVMDFKLTGYGKDLLSLGQFNPEFYAFFDDNIIYDKSYICSGSAADAFVPENQNDIVKRIKKETPYLSTQVIFEDVQDNMQYFSQRTQQDEFGADEYNITYKPDSEPVSFEPRIDMYRHEQMIGDATLDSKTNNMPSWKFVTLQGEISGTY